ncbi:MAG: hypothetical protein K6E93_07995 [Bacteroidales bacterium]|nr:hypothetical protein [Bacteroidales bacterium]
MKTDPKILSTFLAAAVWADGEYDEFEKEFVKDLADELGIPTLTATLETEIKNTESMSEDALADSLEAAAKKVASGEGEGILSLCLQMMCADAYLAQDEMDNFFSFAEILGIDDDTASTILDDFVDEEEDLIIEQ